MPSINENNIVLSENEYQRFMMEALHPSIEASVRRSSFFSELDKEFGTISIDSRMSFSDSSLAEEIIRLNKIKNTESTDTHSLAYSPSHDYYAYELCFEIQSSELSLDQAINTYSKYLQCCQTSVLPNTAA